MIRTMRTLRGKKLLVATIGVGTLTFAACSLFPGCNLVAPPLDPCLGSATYDCYAPDAGKANDGGKDAAPADGSFDAQSGG